MSRTYHHGERRIRVKAIRRNPPDLKRMSRALLELAKAKAEAEAEAQARSRDNSTAEKEDVPPKRPRRTPSGGAA